MRNLNEGKKKAPSYMAELSEIDKQSAIVAMEAKINHLQEMADKKKERLNMVSEDENLSELIDKKESKMMEREIKEIEKAKLKLEKLYEKACGSKPKEMVDEDARTDAEEEGYLDGMKDEKEDMEEGYNTPSYEEGDTDPMNEDFNSNPYNKFKTINPPVNEEFLRMQKLAGIITEGEYKTGLIQERDRDNAGMFSGWGDPSLGLGNDVTTEPSNLGLRSKADAGKTSLSYDVMMKSKDGSKNVQIFATVGDEPKLSYRANGIEDDVVEKWLDKRKDDIQRYFTSLVSNFSKEEMGKNFHIGSGYADKVTDEDIKSIKDGISKLASVKIGKI